MKTKSTFGQLLKQADLFIVVFYKDTPQLNMDYPRFYEELKELAIHLYGSHLVVKIDIAKNEELCDALRIFHNPTYMIYYNEKIVYRKDDYVLPEELLINLINLKPLNL